MDLLPVLLHLVFIFFRLTSTRGQSENFPPSPCPAVYTYEFANEWKGLITIMAPAKFSEMKMEIALGSTVRVPQNQIGRIQLKGSVQDIVAKVAADQSQAIQFYVEFPRVGPTPHLYSIVVNGKEFCRGRPPRDTVTEIKLQSFLRTTLPVPLNGREEFGIVPPELNPTKTPRYPSSILTPYKPPLPATSSDSDSNGNEVPDYESQGGPKVPTEANPKQSAGKQPSRGQLSPGLEALMSIAGDSTLYSINKCNQVSKLLESIYEAEMQRIEIEKQRLQVEENLLTCYKETILRQ